MHKLKTAEEMFGLYDKVSYLINENHNLWQTIKALLSRGNLILLHNTSTGKDEILDFNCNLCEKVGNCTIHEGTYVVGDCHHLEYKEGWEEVG